jgi:serine/threonine protein kinase
VNQDVLIEALMQVSRKRRLLGQRPSERLGDFARHKGVSTLDDVRTWLASGEGLSAHLANQLKEVLPKPDMPAFGAYVPIAHLADGGMGTVWLASSADNKLVVIKTMKATITASASGSVGSEFMRRFEREGRITQQLTHPNVVRSIDNGVCADGTMFMVLEYVDSGDLKDLIEMRGGLTEGLALAIMYQVTDALDQAHKLHLVHRDIKPANIFVGGDGRAKLADFGIARSTEQNRTMLTMEGSLVGSPLYMSPEQILSDPSLDIRSDIYAMGAVLYFCLAAAAPYDGKLQEVLHKHCTAPLPDIRKARPVISELTASIIRGCMEKERVKRYAHPAELRAAIANALVKLGLTPGAPMEEETRDGDLSGQGGSGFRPAVKDENPAGEATISTDLSVENKTASRIEDAHTIAANLLSLAQEDSQATRNLPGAGVDPRTSASAVTLAVRPPAQSQEGINTNITIATGPADNDVVDGDLATALAGDWLTLVSPNAGDPTTIMLIARTKACLGKLREAPVDFCLRNYPVPVHKEACQRISRQHVNIRYDSIQNECIVEDLGSANGSMLDGIAIQPKASCTMVADSENILVVANTVSLWTRCYKRKDRRRTVTAKASNPIPEAVCGLEADHGFDAIVMTRPENRPELAYALVLRRLTIGGPGAQLVCAGARTRNACEIALKTGRWIWRPAQAKGAWKPLTATTDLDCGGRTLRAQAGAYSHFD